MEIKPKVKITGLILFLFFVIGAGITTYKLFNNYKTNTTDAQRVTKNTFLDRTELYAKVVDKNLMEIMVDRFFSINCNGCEKYFNLSSNNQYNKGNVIDLLENINKKEKDMFKKINQCMEATYINKDINQVEQKCQILGKISPQLQIDNKEKPILLYNFFYKTIKELSKTTIYKKSSPISEKYNLFSGTGDSQEIKRKNIYNINYFAVEKCNQAFNDKKTEENNLTKEERYMYKKVCNNFRTINNIDYIIFEPELLIKYYIFNMLYNLENNKPETEVISKKHLNNKLNNEIYSILKEEFNKDNKFINAYNISFKKNVDKTTLEGDELNIDILDYYATQEYKGIVGAITQKQKKVDFHKEFFTYLGTDISDGYVYNTLLKIFYDSYTKDYEF